MQTNVPGGEEADLYPWLKKQGWVVNDWVGATDTEILDWVEGNVEDIRTDGEGNLVIKWTVVDPEGQAHTLTTRGSTLRDCVANARQGLNTLEEYY